MNLKSVKARVAAAIIALGAVATAAPASAGGLNVDLYLGLPGGGYYQGGHWQKQHRPPQHYRSQRRDYGRHHASCSPHEAVRKAHWLGLRHAGVQRVDHRRIVVTGFNRGHRAKIVFARQSPRCSIINSRGI